MNRRKECVAMLLAGGQGSRLKVLTEKTAKPAVPFGGKYRIIDFTLSNCVNSGLDTVGILTQYQPLELNAYIGNGQPWSLNHNFGGAHVLPPYAGSEKSEWYKGTANAIFQNIHFIKQFNPEYVLVLSGDHIYRMDYSQMLDYHKEKNAECTIAVREVPLEEASRFGIMNTREDGSIFEFEEKPEKPKSTKASMGIYIFNWRLLKDYLIEDELDADSTNDFGKDVIPKLLADGRNLFAYAFDGYWKDVGTIESLWQANMDLLDENVPFHLDDDTFRIYARNYANPCSLIGKSATIEHSLVAEGSTVRGTVINSIISTGCTIAEHAVVKDSVIMPNAVIEADALVEYAIVGENTRIGKGARIGAKGQEGLSISVVGSRRRIKDGQVIYNAAQ
ncbi:MAG: glucose-1-phosphate adenylyltransferase [Ruminococcaceae bacterium]|nr:glucose-1-phosphate adenylyltransferase [Oscillospiraceae bacterium]